MKNGTKIQTVGQLLLCGFMNPRQSNNFIPLLIKYILFAIESSVVFVCTLNTLWCTNVGIIWFV